jgi:hypothetical protein
LIVRCFMVAVVALLSIVLNFVASVNLRERVFL